MKTKHLIVFAGFFVALIVAYFALQQKSKTEVVETGNWTLLPELDAQSVSEVQVYWSGSDDKLILKKMDESWTLPSHFNARADGSKIDKLFKDLQELKGETRASQEDLYAVFEVGDDEALRLELLGGNAQTIAALLIGKRAPQGTGAFMRVQGRPEVVLGDKNMLQTFGIYGDERAAPEPKTWVDKNILTSKKDAWSKAEFVQPGLKVSFAKVDKLPEGAEAATETGEAAEPVSVWTQVKPEAPAIPEEQILQILGALERLRGTEVVDPSLRAEYGLDKAPYSARVVLDDESSFGVTASRPDESGPIYAQVEGDEQVFTISDYSLNGIFEKIKNQLAPDKEDASKDGSA